MKKNKKTGSLIWNAVIITVFLAGICILLYPSVSDLWNSYLNEKTVTAYDSAVSKYPSSVLKKEFRKARAYNEQHVTNTIRDAFDNDNYIKTHPYSDLLNPGGDGVMGYLEIPKIREKIVIYHGTGDKTLQRGSGHVEGTSLPIGGKDTHAVIAAHRGLPSAKLFSSLDEMQKGDEFYITILNRKMAYEVDKIKVVTPEDISDFAIYRNRDYVTLLTCTPYGVNSHRLLVRGHRVRYKNHDRFNSVSRKLLNSWQLKVVFAVIALFISFLLIRYIAGKRK